MQLDYSAVWERPQFRAANGRALVEGMRVGVAVCLLRSARSQFVRATIVALCSLVSVVGVSSAHAASGASPSIGTTDDLLASVGEQVPAFGGMYVDEGSGNLYIWLTDQGQSLSSAARALQGGTGDVHSHQPQPGCVACGDHHGVCRSFRRLLWSPIHRSKERIQPEFGVVYAESPRLRRIGDKWLIWRL